MEKRTIDGVEIAYRTTGDVSARPIVLIHGLTANARDWDVTIESLTKSGWRALAPDCLGHGYSSAPQTPEAYALTRVADVLHSLADQAGWKQAVVVGHSMGGAIAQEYAIRHAGDVAALVLVDSAGDMREPLPRSPQHDDFVAQEFALGMEQGMEAVWDLHQEQGGWANAKAATPEVRAWLRARFCKTSPRGYLYGDRALASRRETLPDLKCLKCRTLVMCCENEAPFLKQVSLDLAATIPGARYEVIPNAWHQPHLENSSVFNRALLSFLASV